MSTLISDRPAARRGAGPVAGLAWGALGVLAFSFTVPFTRVAITELSPAFVGAGRAVVAAFLAAIALAATRQRLPTGRQWVRIAVVAGGVVIGFPMLTSYALTATPASHGAMVVGLLPAATAIAAVLRGRERPAAWFWVFSGAGAIAVVAFTGLHNASIGAGIGGFTPADLLLFGAVVSAAIGYAEGGLLARELGSWQVVSWALVVAAPVMIAVTVVSAVQDPPQAGPVPWLAFGYLAVVSMFLGFFAWYRGLAIGPIARVSQVQLVQPVLTMVWAALLLGESLGAATLLGGVVIVLCSALAVRSRVGRRGDGAGRRGVRRGRVGERSPSSRIEEEA